MNGMISNNSFLVSIILISYNSSYFIIDALESIRNLDYTDIELIISDDSSKDSTVEKVTEWLKNNNKRFKRVILNVNKRNLGISGNINKAISVSKGQWIKILAADDILPKNSINIFINYIKKVGIENVDFIHSNVDVYRNNFNHENLLRKTKFEIYKFNDNSLSSQEKYNIAIRFAHTNATAQLIKSEVFNRKNLFYDERYPLHEDKPFLIKCLKNNVRIHFIPEVTTFYRVSDESIQIKSKKGKLISDFTLQRDQFIRENIIKELTRIERCLFRCIFFIRKIFINLHLNRSSKLNASIYKLLLIIPFKCLNNIQKKYILEK